MQKGGINKQSKTERDRNTERTEERHIQSERDTWARRGNVAGRQKHTKQNLKRHRQRKKSRSETEANIAKKKRGIDKKVKERQNQIKKN